MKANLYIQCSVCDHPHKRQESFAPQQTDIVFETWCEGCNRPMRVHSHRFSDDEVWQTQTETLFRGSWTGNRTWYGYISAKVAAANLED